MVKNLKISTMVGEKFENFTSEMAKYALRYGKCGNSASAAEVRFRIPPVFLSTFRFRRIFAFRIPPSKIGLIPNSACQKGPIPPFRNPGKPPLLFGAFKRHQEKQST